MMHDIAKRDSEWRQVPLPSVVFFQEGPGLRKWQWTENGMKVINVTNILGDGRVDTSNTKRYISKEEYERQYPHFLVQDGDVVVASSGNTYGKVGRITSGDLPLMMNTSVIRFHSLQTETLDDGFLYAFLRSDLFSNQVEAFVIGSAQPNFGPTHLSRMSMPLPPIGLQRKIAQMIASYDELIESNQRRIRILEEMARSLYREWFVHFRFPGHENHPRVRSQLGEIPQGWEVRRLGDILELAYGKALKAEHRRGGSIPVYGSSGVVGYHDEALTTGPSIIVGRKGNVGSIAWSDSDFFVIDTAFYVKSDLPKRFLLHALQGKQFLNSDAAVPGLNREQAYSLEQIVPPLSLLEDFSRKADGLGRLASVLAKQIESLRRTRDLLLPRLLSGQIKLEAN